MTLKAIDYDARQHAVYLKARGMPFGMLERWMDVFAGVLPEKRPLSILDLGSGVGRFSPALANRFGGPVFGVEPSAKMRALAEAAPHRGVEYSAGEGAGIPLDDSAADAVLMFLSFHHMPDRLAAAREIARVLRPGGRVLIRGVFSDRLPDVWWSPFFPGWQDIQAKMFPSLDETVAAFGEVGLSKRAFLEIEETYSANQTEAVERLRLRGISGFDHFDVDALDAGFERLDRALASDGLQVPLEGRSDLLVLG